jgi:hypothetical protein
MAHIKEEILQVKVSTLTKNNNSAPSVLSDDIVSTLEQVVTELLGFGVVVEVEKIQE